MRTSRVAVITGIWVIALLVSLTNGFSQTSTPEVSPHSEERSGASASEPIDTSDWKTYRNEDAHYEVQYPSNWEVKDLYLDPERRESTVDIFYIPPEFLSFAEADEGVVLHIFYSETSASAVVDIEEIEKAIRKFPENFVSAGLFRGLKEIKGKDINIHCYTTSNLGVYIVTAIIADPFDRRYEDKIAQILSTFWVVEGKSCHKKRFLES